MRLKTQHKTDFFIVWIEFFVDRRTFSHRCRKKNVFKFISFSWTRRENKNKRFFFVFQAEISTSTMYKRTTTQIFICFFFRFRFLSIVHFLILLKTVKFSWKKFIGRMCQRFFIVSFIMIFICFGNMWSANTFFEYPDPINGCKPFVIFNIFGSIFKISKTFR